MKNKIKKRILAMLAVASLFVTPSVIQAQNITKTDATKSGTITVDGNITNVLPDRTVNGGKTAINQFANFELDSGNIANLHFEKAGTLVNFVDSKASINGIVNAVKDNKIGGNLYFLSPNGIAVGASSVINAGKVGMIVPNEKFYNSMLKMDNLSDSTFTQEKINQIALNGDGSIVIEGSINAPSGITLAAQNVKIEPGALDEVGLSVDKLEEPLTASITVGKGAKIISDSDVTLMSTAISNRSTKEGNSYNSKFLGLKSELDIAGSIKAKNINLASTIVDNYTNTSIVNGEDSDYDFGTLLQVFFLMNVSNILQDFANVSNSYVFRADEASLNIADTAKLDAAKIFKILQC